MIAQEYERTGYVWEQYDAVTGEGRRRYDSCCQSNFFSCRSESRRRSHPFTGWTSLTALSELMHLSQVVRHSMSNLSSPCRKVLKYMLERRAR